MLQAIVLRDMHNCNAEINSLKVSFQKLHTYLSPCLIVPELDYTQEEERRPFVIRVRELNKVCGEGNYRGDVMSERVYNILIKGERLYSVRFRFAGQIVHVIWNIPSS